MAPMLVHSDLIGRDGALLTPESSMGTDGSQQWVLSEDSAVTFAKTGHRGGFAAGAAAHPGTHVKELFDGTAPEEQPTMETATDMEGAEAVLGAW
ncbi:unnamed protein product [Caretta caretta]